MADVAVADGRWVASELYDVLRSVDRQTWREDLAAALHQRLTAIQERFGHLLDGSHLAREALGERLTALMAGIREHAPDVDAGREAWLAFRARMIPTYESLASWLRAERVPVPSLRPQNLKRSIFHVSMALTVLLLLEEVLSLQWVIIAPGLFAGTFWFLELLRRRSERANDFLMWLFRHIAHPHERVRVNSSTWYATALFVIAFIQEPLVLAVAVAVFGVGDPAAAFVGRRWGKVQLVHGRTLEGSLTFFAVATAAAMGALLVWHPGASLAQMLGIAVFSSAVGALTELLSNRLDDNFTTPIAAAAGAWAAAVAFGALL
jgi:dolichol kinase